MGTTVVLAAGHLSRATEYQDLTLSPHSAGAPTREAAPAPLAFRTRLQRPGQENMRADRAAGAAVAPLTCAKTQQPGNFSSVRNLEEA